MGLLLPFEQHATRDDEVSAALFVFGDEERIHTADVLRRFSASDDVDLRHRAKGALPRDSHFVAALHLAFDLALDRKTGAERLLELARADGAERELARQLQSTGC